MSLAIHSCWRLLQRDGDLDRQTFEVYETDSAVTDAGLNCMTLFRPLPPPKAHRGKISARSASLPQLIRRLAQVASVSNAHAPADRQTLPNVCPRNRCCRNGPLPTMDRRPLQSPTRLAWSGNRLFVDCGQFLRLPTNGRQLYCVV